MSEHHTIKITVEPEQVTGEFSCSAPVGADCRLSGSGTTKTNNDSNSNSRESRDEEGQRVPVDQ